MNLKANDRRQRYVAIAFFAFVLIATGGCSTFHGPGHFQAGYDDLAGDSDELLSVLPDGSTRPTEANRNIASETSDEVGFDWPVESARLTQPFRLHQGRPHWGIDLAAPRGTSILAAESGYVVYTGRGFHGYGKLIVIEHRSGWATLYSHLDKITAKEGQFVNRGDVIGAMGRTGRASGVHLHFEVRHQRQPVNPLAYLPNPNKTSDARIAQTSPPDQQ